MPASVRFALTLTLIAVVWSPIALFVVYWRDNHEARVTAEQLTLGHVDAGKAAIGRYGCGACHQISGIKGAQGRVGPALNGIATRALIAGRLANQPGNMTLWLRHPQAVVPGNGMPEMGVTDRDARDIAAYLYTLRR